MLNVFIEFYFVIYCYGFYLLSNPYKLSLCKKVEGGTKNSSPLYLVHLLNLFFPNLFDKYKWTNLDFSINGIPVEKGKISHFGLARNLIRHLISPNQDDLSYSPRTFISGHQIV